MNANEQKQKQKQKHPTFQNCSNSKFGGILINDSK